MRFELTVLRICNPLHLTALPPVRINKHMNYIEYIDLPPVPEHLIEQLQDIVNKPPKNFSYVSQENQFFKTRYVSNDLKSWLQPLFEFEIYPQYQLVYDGLPIHIDKGNRIFAYNYLLDTGGDDVKTAVYDENYKLLQSEKLELKRWHRLNTGMLHTVYGMDPNRVRIALSIGLHKK